MKTIRNVLTAIAAYFLLSAGAYSHTQLSSSVPADAAVLEAAPTELALSFSEAVRLTAVAIESGDESDALKIEVTDPATEFSVALPALAPGDHLVRWRALSGDTHVVSGEIRFRIAD